MATPPRLFDPTARARHLARARALIGAGADGLFLHRLAAEELKLRLGDINRTFTRPALIGPFAEPWLTAMPPGTRVVPDAPTLDLEPGAHDLIVHALALHAADDPVGQLVQMRRALVPDGLAIAALFGGQSLHELRSVLAEAELAETGGISPRVAPMGEIRDLGGLLMRAGLALPVADSLTLELAYRDLGHLARDLRAMGETNALAERRRVPMRRGMLARAAALYAAHHAAADGRIRVTVEILFLTGWAPGPGQQQPLRPGSAAARLADALGTTERPAGEPARPGPRI